ncbi:hypothetical protein [Leisingera sp. NJS201]
MIWLLVLVVLLIAAAPFLRERLRKPMNTKVRQSAPAPSRSSPAG